MDVAYKGETLFSESCFAPDIPGKETSELSRVSHAVDTNVDHSRAGLHEVACDEPGTPDRCYQDVSLSANNRKVARLRVADRDSGIRIEQQHRHRLADNITAANHDGI